MSIMPTTTGYFNHELPYVQFGDGPKPLVVLPGASDAFSGPIDGLKSWFLNWHFRRFTDSFTIYYVRRPTEMPDGYTIEEMADAYADAITDRFSEPVAVYGLSMGGCIAQVLAGKHPDIVDRLVLGVSGCRITEQGTAIAKRWAGFAEAHDWEAIYEESIDVTYSGWRQSLYGALASLPADLTVSVPPVPSDVVVTMNALADIDVCDRLTDIDAPTLVVGGDEDVFFDEQTLRATADAIPDARLYLFRRHGHGVFDEEKRPFDRTVHAFLTETL